LQSLLDNGKQLEKIAGWLEIDTDTLPTASCFFDSAECTDGFTVQFWFKAVECTQQVFTIYYGKLKLKVT